MGQCPNPQTGRAWFCAGDVTCHAFNVADFLASTLLQRHHRARRVIYWKEHIGRAVFSPQHPGYARLQNGVLCKFSAHGRQCSGYFFLAFNEKLTSLPILKNIVVVLVEKLKDYFDDIIVREKQRKRCSASSRNIKLYLNVLRY